MQLGRSFLRESNIVEPASTFSMQGKMRFPGSSQKRLLQGFPSDNAKLCSPLKQNRYLCGLHGTSGVGLP